MKKHILLLLVSITSLAQKPQFITTRPTQATVYFNSVNLTHEAKVSIPVGTTEVVLKNVANYLNENTIQVKVPDGVTILSSQFTNNYISEYEIDEQDAGIKKVRDSINWVTTKIAQLNNKKNTNNKTIELLDANQRLGGATQQINVAELMKLTDYYNSKRLLISNEQLMLDEEITELTNKNIRLNARLQINTSKEEKLSQGKILLQIASNKAMTFPLEISYMAYNASWNPSYDFKIKTLNEPLNILYKAQITQNTGVDWKNIHLTLSSGKPTETNQIPTIEPWFLNYAFYDKRDKAKATAEYKSMPQMEVAVIKESSLGYAVQINQNQLSTSFDIDLPYTILSNKKPHSVSMQSIILPAEYQYICMPKYNHEAYLTANVSDYGKYNLLAGEANIIFEDLYVGKTYLNPNVSDEKLQLSLGKDPKIAVTYEKVADKSGVKFLSSNKEQTFTYDISIRNNKKDKIKIDIIDQFPLSTQDDIQITQLESSGGMVDKETGKVMWKLQLKPNESKVLRISYLVKYPKDQHIDNL